jgi:hypothetical protein
MFRLATNNAKTEKLLDINVPFQANQGEKGVGC